jgi:undecaprenyl-diphosphatase
MAAVVLFFWRDLVRIIGAWCSQVLLRRKLAEPGRRDAQMGWFIIIGTLPISIFGLLFKDQIETTARDLRIIATTLIILGALMWLVDKTSAQRKTVSDLTWSQAKIFGCAQALALVPGVSRSGATITAGRALSFSREAAARYSFLLSIPAVVLSGLLEAVTKGTGGGVPWPQTILATVVAFVVGYVSIAWLLKWLVTHSTFVFAAYRVALGAAVWILIANGTLAPK